MVDWSEQLFGEVVSHFEDIQAGSARYMPYHPTHIADAGGVESMLTSNIYSAVFVSSPFQHFTARTYLCQKGTRAVSAM